MRLEAILGGALAIFVAIVALYALIVSAGGRIPPPPQGGGDPPVIVGEPSVCECFRQGYDLAGKNVGVMSAQYRSGFEQCAAHYKDGGAAWTAGWNARLSSASYASSCRIWLQSRS